MLETSATSPRPVFDPATVPRIAVLIPCFNEATSIASVVADFKAALPNADIYVYDNDSTDDTAAIAREAGARVFVEPVRGKGSVIRRMFADIDAQVYLLVDGDATYDASAAPMMVDKFLRERLDMLNAARVSSGGEVYRFGHAWGNKTLTRLVAALFGRNVIDMLSGYRIVSRRFVKSFPARSNGFDVETELTIHALELNLPMAEVSTRYMSRLPGSTSKLRTYADGYLIVKTILFFIKHERPLAFFGVVAAIFFLSALALGFPILQTYLQTSLVPRLPTALLSTGLIILSALFLVTGFILDSVTLARREVKRLLYLASSSH